jgi:formate dehydrogenase major subunit
MPRRAAAIPRCARPGSDKWERISWDDAFARIAKAGEGRPRQEFHRPQQGRPDGQSLDLDRASSPASATTNETAYLTYKVVRSLGMVVFDNQARV